MTIGQRIKLRREELNISQEELAQKIGYKSRSSINKIELDLYNLKQSKIKAISDALDTSPAYIMGWDDNSDQTQSPTDTGDIVVFPIIGDIAAGYDRIAVEDWSGDKIEVPRSYLHGRSKDKFIALTVRGDSMYPLYHNGDVVLILKQDSLSRSGEIGAILYDDGCATIKKVEYVQGEDWMRLVPINPNYQPEMIVDERLEHCKVIGVPKLLIRQCD